MVVILTPIVLMVVGIPVVLSSIKEKLKKKKTSGIRVGKFLPFVPIDAIF